LTTSEEFLEILTDFAEFIMSSATQYCELDSRNIDVTDFYGTKMWLNFLGWNQWVQLFGWE